MTTQAVARILEHKRQTCGTEHYYLWSPLFRTVVATDGAKLVADEANTYWLLDAIASWIPEAEVAGESFQVWTLNHGPDDSVILVCDDGNERELVRQDIAYSDFPRELLPFKLFVQEGGPGWVIMLPEEY